MVSHSLRLTTSNVQEEATSSYIACLSERIIFYVTIFTGSIGYFFGCPLPSQTSLLKKMICRVKSITVLSVTLYFRQKIWGTKINFRQSEHLYEKNYKTCSLITRIFLSSFSMNKNVLPLARMTWQSKMGILADRVIFDNWIDSRRCCID